MCVITLTEFPGITAGGGPFTGPGIPPYIRVSGTITGCPPPQPGFRPTVSIITSCSGVVRGISVNAFDVFTYDVPNLEGCTCGSLRTITITCDNDPNDPTCNQTFTPVLLVCGKDEPPPECPAGSPLGANITVHRERLQHTRAARCHGHRDDQSGLDAEPD